MELLETTAQSHEIEKIISESNDFLIIASPYLSINNRLKPKLAACFKRNRRSFILYRDNQLNSVDMDWLDSFKNVIPISIRNLHAKCYLNEKTALITSMNLIDYSQVNNHEIGVKISIDKNPAEIKQLLSFINSIISTDHPTHEFAQHFQVEKTHTMGELYAELINEYEFPLRSKELDGAYVYMCDIARRSFQFQNEDIKQDGTALKRTTILNEKTYFTLRKELIANAELKIKDTFEEKRYSPSEFKSKWNEHLISRFGDVEFRKDVDIITANNFLFKNVEFSTRYGFASFSFDLGYDYMDKIKDVREFEILTKLKNYRLFWSPANKMNIYHAKNVNFKNVHEDIKYCTEALDKILLEIERFAQ